MNIGGKWVKTVIPISLILLAGSFAVAQELKTPPEEENGIISTEKKIEIPLEMEEEWGEFKARYGDAFTSVEWDFGCACVRELYGYYDTGRGELKSEADAEALAREFLSENAGLFKIDISSLGVKRLRQNKKFGYWNVEYEQTYNGIPVYRGEVGITLSSNSVIKSLGNNFYPGIDISTKPKITKEEAARIAEDEVNGYRNVESVEPYIFPQPKDGKLEYRVTWRTYFKGAYFFVDAVNGEIIHKEYTVTANGGINIKDVVRAEPNESISVEKDTAANGEVVSKDAVAPTLAQTEGPSSSSSTIFVGLAALAIAAILIIWRLKK